MSTINLFTPKLIKYFIMCINWNTLDIDNGYAHFWRNRARQSQQRNYIGTLISAANVSQRSQRQPGTFLYNFTFVHWNKCFAFVHLNKVLILVYLNKCLICLFEQVFHVCSLKQCFVIVYFNKCLVCSLKQLLGFVYLNSVSSLFIETTTCLCLFKQVSRLCSFEQVTRLWLF